MKHAALITIHVGPNFGTVLQAIATTKILKDHNISTTIVNYIPPRCTKKRIYKKTNSYSSKPIIMRALLKFLAGIRLLWNNYWFNERIYLGCLEKWCNLSSPIYPSDKFALKCPKADYYVTGSDQVWNTFHNEGVDTHYFFDGISGKKIALASSIGMDVLTDDEAKVFSEFLSQYSAVSVREESGVKILRQIGIESCQVLDPTLMINRNEWYSMFHCLRHIKDDYLLVYIPYNIHDKNEIYRFARKEALKRGLKVVTFSWNKTKEPLADITINHASPTDFLSLMYYADFVVTNSFHGTAFSINLNRNFAIYLPTKFPSRVLSILALLNLEDRVIEYGCDELKDATNIDYSGINIVLDRKRKDMHDFIDKNFI